MLKQVTDVRQAWKFLSTSQACYKYEFSFSLTSIRKIGCQCSHKVSESVKKETGGKKLSCSEEGTP